MKQRKKKRDNRSRFVKNPFKFTKELLDKEGSGTLHCVKNEVEGYLHETHSDPLRYEPLGQCPNEVKVDPPEALIDVREPTWKELKEVVKKARSGSAPGLNGIPCNLEEMDNTGMLEREKCTVLAKRILGIWRRTAT